MRMLSAKGPVILTILVLASLVGFAIWARASDESWANTTNGLAVWAGGAGVAALVWVAYGFACLCWNPESGSRPTSIHADWLSAAERGHSEDCESESHDQHLCYIEAMSIQPISVSGGRGQWSQEQYQAMVTDPRFECDNCGRVARDAKSLCQPVRIADNDQCEDVSHDNHLCYMMAKAAAAGEPLIYLDGWSVPASCEDLVKHGRHKCGKCGRQAKDAANLCEPPQL